MNRRQAEPLRRLCLVHVFGPGHVLAALCAVEWYGMTRNGDESADVVVLIHNPGLSDALAHKSADVVRQMISPHGWPEPIVLTRGEMDGITGGQSRNAPRQVLQRFRQKLGRNQFDEIYYPHDLVGCAAQLATHAYPRATPITFGDALGNITTRQHQFGLLAVMDPRSLTWSQRVARVARALRRRTKRHEAASIHAREAVLILPIDESGDGLLGTELIIVPRHLVLEVLSRCQRAVPELAVYSQRLLAGTPAPQYLMLLENFADANLTSFEREVAMYEAMVERHVPRGATVFVKGHPLSVKPVEEDLCRRLSSRFAVRLVSPDFGRYPVELWGDLLASCEVISLGYPCLSLEFLYGKKVIYPFLPEMIEEFFPRVSGAYLLYCDRYTRAQRISLASWDGRGLLLRGPVS